MDSLRMHSVLVVGADMNAAREIEKSIKRTSKYQTVATDVAGMREALNHTPDAAVLDVLQISDEELNVLNELRSRFDDLPIIVTSEALDDDQMRRLFKLKVSDWLRTQAPQARIVHAAHGDVPMEAVIGALPLAGRRRGDGTARHGTGRFQATATLRPHDWLGGDRGGGRHVRGLPGI